MRMKVSFSTFPIRVELKGPMPDGSGGALSYTNMSLGAAEAELQTPLEVEVEVPDGEDASLRALEEALRIAAVSARTLVTDQFFAWVDELEAEMAKRKALPEDEELKIF